jgi:preprotein translocase subunit SecB
MAENETQSESFGSQPNGADTDPAIGLIAQYVKDLSFENPNSPAVYQQQAQPNIDVQFNIAVTQPGDDVHEVAMKIEIRAEADGGMTLFAVELVYAGLFGARNVPEDQLRPFLYGEAPRLLFPFARRVVAEAVRDGNFPPLLLDPIDFSALYMAQAAQADQLAAGEPAGEA